MKSTYFEGPAIRGVVQQWLKPPRYGLTLSNNFQAMVKHVRTLGPVLETRSQTIILLVVGATDSVPAVSQAAPMYQLDCVLVARTGCSYSKDRKSVV